jgi:hypothetical protein
MPFRLLIVVLGATLLGAQIYGISHHPEKTVTGNMQSESLYLVLTSCSLLLQSFVWALCLYQKSFLDPEAAGWGLVTLSVMLVSWIGLTSILTTDVHYIFTGVFVVSFVVLILILCYLVWQPLPSLILRLCLLLELVCITAMLILFNSKEFYLPEQIGFIAYTLIFMAFFLTHPYRDWDEPPPQMYLPTHSLHWQECD